MKEAILAYFFLLVEADHRHTIESLDDRVEKWILDTFEIAGAAKYLGILVFWLVGTTALNAAFLKRAVFGVGSVDDDGEE